MSFAIHTAHALTAILRCHGGKGSVVSYGESFSALWALVLDDASPDPPGDYSRLFVVWDGVPPAIVNGVPSDFAFRKYLTIYDWAIAMTLAVDRRGKRKAPNIHVYVLDVTDHRMWR